MPVEEFAPKRGKAGSTVNILGSGFDALTNPRAAFGATESSAALQNPQHLKTTVPSLPDGVFALRLKADNAPDELIGGFNVGPPINGLVLNSVFPDTITKSGGATLYITGNGFTEGGRTSTPTVLFNGSAARTGDTRDNSLILVASTPSSDEAGAAGGDTVEVKVTFSDGQVVIGAVTFGAR